MNSYEQKIAQNRFDKENELLEFLIEMLEYYANKRQATTDKKQIALIQDCTTMLAEKIEKIARNQAS